MTGTDILISLQHRRAHVPVLNQDTTGTAANVTGTVAIENGGTGAVTWQDAINALTWWGADTPAGAVLRCAGPDGMALGMIEAADMPAMPPPQDPLGCGVNHTYPWFSAATAGASATAWLICFIPLIAGGYPMTRIWFQIATQAGNMQVGWYRGNGAAVSGSMGTVPGTLMAASGEYAVPAASEANNPASLPLGGTYTPALGDFLAVMFDSASACIYSFSLACPIAGRSYCQDNSANQWVWPATAAPTAGAWNAAVLYGA